MQSSRRSATDSRESEALGSDSGAPAAFSHATAQRIMVAAVDLFQKRGFKGTSVRDITTTCGLTPGALYVYFDSKDSLLRDIVRYADHLLEEQTNRSLSELDSDDPVEVFVKLVEAYARYLMDHQKMATVGARYWQELRPAAKDVTLAVRRRVTTRFADAIQHALEEGAIESVPHGEVRLTAASLLELLNGLLEWYRPEGRLGKDDLLAILTEMACRLIGAPVPAGQGSAGNGPGDAASAATSKPAAAKKSGRAKPSAAKKVAHPAGPSPSASSRAH